MKPLKFNSNYAEWKHKYDNERVYTRKDMAEVLAKKEKELTVNRVVQSFTGLYGPDDCKAMQILAIHKTPEGVLIIVK